VTGDQGHAHAAPHGGTLVELGDEFAHLELLFDTTEGRITIFVLDGEAETAVRISDRTLAVVIDDVRSLANRPLELAPVASPLTGEVAGDASEFAVVVPGLRGRPELAGRVLTFAVRGRVFRDVPFRASATSHLPGTTAR
jgi:hypothetical protein